ncbi:MAG: threonylcarbamoyl-AMP synthase [Roseburia sp.]|nr:threonylcarbamoyl-AMP synthase [Roseburia sp.]
MQTKIIKLDPNNIDNTALCEAAAIIREGGLVAFPTETVYGLGADALHSEASKKIYAAKGRPSDNPLIVHISSYKDLLSIAKEVPPEAKKLADAFWPGPLTMIVWKNDNVPPETTGGMDTVAVRMPNHPIALRLIAESGCLIAAPSANTSGKPSPTEASHVALDMNGRIPMILDGGPVGIGIESTIIDLTEAKPMILRPGYITKDMLEAVLEKEVEIDPGILASEAACTHPLEAACTHPPGDITGPEASGLKPKAPGMRYKHYAPKADLVLVDGEAGDVVAKINELVQKKQETGQKIGVIATDETKSLYQSDYVVSIGARQDEDAIARHLYKILREFDDLNVDAIYSESFSTPRMGQAIMNRLLKAAGHQVIHV